MKKLLKHLFVCTLVLVLYSCDKESEDTNDTNELPSIENLAEDALFIEYIESLTLVNNTFVTSTQAYVSELNESYPNLNIEEQADFAALLGFDSYESLQLHLYDLLVLEQQLEEEFRLSEQDIESITSESNTVLLETINSQLTQGHIFVTGDGTLGSRNQVNNNDRVLECYMIEQDLVATDRDNSCYSAYTSSVDPLDILAQRFRPFNDDCLIPSPRVENTDEIIEFLNSCNTKDIIDIFNEHRNYWFDYQCCLFNHCAADPGSINDIPSNWFAENCEDPLIG